MRVKIDIFRTAAICALLTISRTQMRADLLDDVNQALSIRDEKHQFQLQITGLMDFEGYYIDQRPPGLIYTDNDFLINPRLTMFLDAQWTSHWYLFAQLRIDRGFDPSDQSADVRMDEYFLRYTPLDRPWISLQVGKFATVVGNWVGRHYSWDNPFINAPLPYENLTGIWDSEAPDDVDDLQGWAHVGKYDSGDYSDKYLRLPLIWGPSYATGFSISGTVEKFDYAAEVKNAALASRPEAWDATKVGFDNPTVSTRLGFRPNEMWNLGISGSVGPYLLPQAAPTLPRGRDIDDYRELLLGQDLSFAWRHWQVWAEVYEVQFEVPRIGSASTLSYYVETKYKFTPQLFGAVRWNEQFYGTVRDEDGLRVRWGNDIWRVDSAVGYRFTNYLQLKVQYSFSHADKAIQEGEQLVAGQVTIKF
jgi:hypothetical protein